MSLRKKTETFFPDGDNIFRISVQELYPEIKEYADVIFSNQLLQLLVMFLFLCYLGFTRKWDVIDPLTPLSNAFIDLLKQMINNS